MEGPGTGDHEWSQRHLSHYVEGDLRPRSRRRLERHARDCVECGSGIRAMRVSVSSWQTNDADVARVIKAVANAMKSVEAASRTTA